MTAGVFPLNGGCWADPLSRTERKTLARKLASACGAAWRARTRGLEPGYPPMGEYVKTSMEMSELHMDVTERAQVAAS